jgi:Flp pilus assembly pilin Flp
LEEVRNVKVASYVEVGLLLAIATPILVDIISGTVQADLAGVLNDIVASTISF